MDDYRDATTESVKKSILYWERFWHNRDDRHRELTHEIHEVESEMKESEIVLKKLEEELKGRKP